MNLWTGSEKLRSFQRQNGRRIQRHIQSLIYIYQMGEDSRLYRRWGTNMYPWRVSTPPPSDKRSARALNVQWTYA